MSAPVDDLSSALTEAEAAIRAQSLGVSVSFAMGPTHRLHWSKSGATWELLVGRANGDLVRLALANRAERALAGRTIRALYDALLIQLASVDQDERAAAEDARNFIVWLDSKGGTK